MISILRVISKIINITEGIAMKIIIVGDGKVGYSLAETLSQEDNDVTIIDKNL